MLREELSIIFIPSKVHRARFLHKTLLNIQASIPGDITLRLSVVNSDEVRSYFNKHTQFIVRYADNTKDLKDEVSDGVCLIIEEGDLFSSSWLHNAISLALEDQGALFHTSQTVFINTRQVWNKLDSSEPDTLLSLIAHNQWDFPLVTNIKNIPSNYPLDNSWGLNEQTLSRGLEHKVIKETVHFSRSAPDLADPLHTIEFAPVYESIRYNNLSATDKTSTSAPKKLTRSKLASSREMLRRVHVKLKRQSRVYTAIAMPAIRRLEAKILSRVLEPWSINAWKDVHSFDRTTFPTKDSLQGLSYYTSLDTNAGKVYLDLQKKLSPKLDYLFISQHMMKGGGDKVVLNYINTLAEIKPKWNIGLLVSEPFNNNWRSRVPENVMYADFGNEAEAINPSIKHRLLARLIVQTKTRRIMLAMTPFAFEMIEKFPGTFSKENYQIDSVAFCSDTDLVGRTWGIHFFGIPETFNSLHRVMTDNAHVIEETLELEPLSREKFVVHYQPANFKLRTPSIRNGRTKNSLKILWASRVANQKRPDVVIEIAKKMKGTNHHIDIFGNLENDYREEDFNSIENLTYRGGFDGFDSLPLSEYDAFLYTSSFDGVPNVLLEASAYGLPIVAPNVGGISEFIIHQKTGLLIEDIDNTTAFVEAIQFIAKNPDKSLELVRKAQKLITTQHSQKRFKESVQRDFTE